MQRILFFAALVLFAGSSCKHQQKIAKTSPEPNSNSVEMPSPARAGGMTAGKAGEEEIFVQGCIEKSLGNSRKAIVQFQECLSMNPNSAAANYEIAGLYAQLGENDRALKYAKAANDIAPENRWYKFRYAGLLLDNGQADEAVKVFRDLSDKEPENTDLLFRYANALKKAGKPDDALKAYDRIEALEGISDTLNTSRIAVYRSKGDKAGEENALKALALAFPSDLGYQERLGDFYSANNQPEKAAEVYRSMIAKYPDLVVPHLKLAGYYKSINQNEKAFAEAEKGFENPGFTEEKTALLKSWYPVSETDPALSPAASREADSLCRVLCRVDADHAAPFVLSADYLLKAGKVKEARDLYHKAIAIEQDEYAPWKRLLEINEKLKDNVAQEKDAKQAQDLFPTQPDAYYYLGMVQYNKKEYKKAIDNLESAKDYTIDNPARELQIKTVLIDAYRNAGNDEKADLYSEDVLAADSSNLPLIAAYCKSLSERKVKLYKAEQWMLKVVEKEPGNASYLETLAWIEYGLGDYKEAGQWMTKALDKLPNDARMNERMGDIQFHAGNKDEAHKYWEKAKSNGGNSPALEKKISDGSMPDNE